MKTSDETIQMRLAGRGLQGEPLSLISGKETLEELRELIIEFSEDCPSGHNHPHCPFCVMSGLSYDSLANLVNHMSRENCLNLFEQELQCRFQTKSTGRKDLATM